MKTRNSKKGKVITTIYMAEKELLLEEGIQFRVKELLP
jgi:hypothetical protein